MFQTRSVLRWSWQRHAPKSRLLNFKGTLKTGTWDEKSREIPCPSKLKEPEISNFNSSKQIPYWTATIIVVAGEKLFSKRLWHRLRPPAVVVLDVHRGLRRQQQLGALHAAVECCIVQRSPTSAPQASEAPAAAPRRLWAPGPPLATTSTAAPFARRKATTAVRSLAAATCSAATRPNPAPRPPANSKSRSRQRRSRRRWPRTAARSPWRAAAAMLSSRRGAKWSSSVPLIFMFYRL